MPTDTPHPVPPKSPEEMARQWDAIAKVRHQQIASGLDVSFQHVLAPLVFELLEGSDQTRLLDVGCGTGELTALLTGEAGVVTGLDPSIQSLKIAAEALDANGAEFLHGTLEQLAQELATRRYTAAVAAMTLMTVSDIRSFARAASQVLPAGAHLVATMTHPCFWPRYWAYERQPWFVYERELFIEAPFRISFDSTREITTHVHRPLAMYFQEFADAGFMLESIREPVPPANLHQTYLDNWRFPRFLGIKWRRAN